MKFFCKDHIVTLETVLYIEVVFNPEVIQWNLYKGHTKTLEIVPYKGCP